MVRHKGCIRDLSMMYQLLSAAELVVPKREGTELDW